MSTLAQDREFNRILREECVDVIEFQSSSLETAIEFISKEFDPEDIFSESDLEAWAESKGYVKQD